MSCQMLTCDTICHSQEDGLHHACNCCSNCKSYYYITCQPMAWFAFGKLLLPLPDYIFVPHIAGNWLQGTWCNLPSSQWARGGCLAVLLWVILPLLIKGGHDTLPFSSLQVALIITLVMMISFHLGESCLACIFKYILSFSVDFNLLLLGCWSSLSFPSPAGYAGRSGIKCCLWRSRQKDTEEFKPLCKAIPEIFLSFINRNILSVSFSY